MIAFYFGSFSLFSSPNFAKYYADLYDKHIVNNYNENTSEGTTCN